MSLLELWLGLRGQDAMQMEQQINYKKNKIMLVNSVMQADHVV